jgi:hypothetical protein
MKPALSIAATASGWNLVTSVPPEYVPIPSIPKCAAAADAQTCPK